MCDYTHVCVCVSTVIEAFEMIINVEETEESIDIR